VIEQSGFAQRHNEFSPGSEVDYGIVLRNVSRDEAALNVTVVVNFVDAANRILKTETNYVEAIPADSVFYYGFPGYLSDSATVSKLETRVQIGQSDRRSFSIPTVSNVRISADPYLGTRVAGEFSNPSTRTLSGLARISAVIFDQTGRVVGGGRTYPDAPLPPGARAGFEIWASATPPGAAARAAISVEPEYS
jgi:hypothetical protein